MSRALTLLALSLALATPAAAQGAKAPAEQLKDEKAARALAEVKLASEIERSDAQVYLMRLELSVVKRQLADALAKCGAPCQPAAAK